MPSDDREKMAYSIHSFHMISFFFTYWIDAYHMKTFTDSTNMNDTCNI